jgi:hypothetical protein
MFQLVHSIASWLIDMVGVLAVIAPVPARG